MELSLFLSAMGLCGTNVPAMTRWSMLGTEFPATARLDHEPGAEVIELGIYETVDGETIPSAIVTRYDRESGTIEFKDEEDEMFFERFCETVRLMAIEPLTE